MVDMGKILIKHIKINNINRLILLIFPFIFCRNIYSQNEIKKDSLKLEKEIKEDSFIITSSTPNGLSYKLITHKDSISNPIDIKLENKISIDKSEIRLPDHLNYKLKLTPDLIPQRLFPNLSYSLNEYTYDYGFGSYRQGGIEFVYKPLDKLTLNMAGYIVNYNIFHSKFNDLQFNFNSMAISMCFFCLEVQKLI